MTGRRAPGALTAGAAVVLVAVAGCGGVEPAEQGRERAAEAARKELGAFATYLSSVLTQVPDGPAAEEELDRYFTSQGTSVPLIARTGSQRSGPTLTVEVAQFSSVPPADVGGRGYLAEACARMVGTVGDPEVTSTPSVCPTRPPAQLPAGVTVDVVVTPSPG